MPLSEDRVPFPAPDPGRFKQLKLHEIALAYAGALHKRVCMLAAELAEALGKEINPTAWDAVAWARYFRLSLGETLQAVLSEQRGESASPFVEVICAAFAEDLSSAKSSSGGSQDQMEEYRSFAEFLAERRAPAPSADPAHLAAAAGVAGARVGELLALADLRAVEGVCDELLTRVFHWDGRRFTISGQRAIEAQNLAGRCHAARFGDGLAEDPKVVQNVIKLALTMFFFWREPAPSTLAKLKAYYIALGAQSHPKPARNAGAGEKRFKQSPGARDGLLGGAERDLAEEIELFCRTLSLLRETIGVL